MPTASKPDVFGAISEVRRREILGLLAEGERPVNDVVATLGMAQPQVSKHLRILREVGLVRVRVVGRHRLYSVNGDALRPVHDWVRTFERFWEHKLDRVKARAEGRVAQHGTGERRRRDA